MMRHNSALQRDSFGRKLRKTRHSVVVAGLAIVWLGCTPLVSQADAITYTRSGVSINETFGHLPGLGDGNVDPLSSFTFARYVVVDEPPGRVSLAAEATAYATVVQRAAGSSELPFRLHFRAQAFARPFLGYTVNSSASALIEVQDTLKFQPQSGVPASSLVPCHTMILG